MPNMVGGIETSSPEDVNEDMKRLLEAYGNKTDISFEDLIETCYDGQDTIKAMINVFGIK